MKKLKQFETKKLHYGKYLYKLVLSNSLSSIFRTDYQRKDTLSYARSKLDELSFSYERGETLLLKRYRTDIEVDVNTFLDAKDVYTALKSSQSEYKIRIDSLSHLSIYSNDKSILDLIVKKIRSGWMELWVPTLEYTNYLSNNENIILVDKKPKFPYKVTLGGKKVPVEFATWLKANTDKSKIGSKALEQIENHSYVNGFYFYIRDEKVLNLIQMLVGHNIRRVDKLIYKEDIDK
jgi:hypothetical protein